MTSDVADIGLPPLPVDAWEDGLLEGITSIVGGEFRSDGNVYCTLANHPRLFEAWMSLGAQILRGSSLHPRDRELVILRTTALCQAPYPFVQHTRIGLEVGMAQEEIDAVVAGRSDPRWASIDRVMLTAVDELLAQGAVSDGIWAELTDNFSTRQVIDLIATTAFYRMASWVLNSCRTPLDPGQAGSPPLATPGLVTPSTRGSGPRMAPVPVEAWPTELAHMTLNWPRFADRPERRSAGVYCTLANHPELFASIGPLMAHLLANHSLADRHRELVIIRSCLLDRGEYPYRQHVRIGAETGLSESDLGELAAPEPSLAGADGALCRLVDELHRANTVSDRAWEVAAEHFDHYQVMDTIVTAGFYGLVSFVLNSAGTTLEPGDVLLPSWLTRKE